MADTPSGNSTVLYLGLAAVAAYLLFKPKTGAPVDPTSPAPGPSPTLATGEPAGNTAAANSGGRPGYAVDGDEEVRYSTQAGVVGANGAGGFLDTQWGDGSRNVRLTLARVVGQQYHLFVDDLLPVLSYRFNQGGFGVWDDLYYSFINAPDSLAKVLQSFNQDNPGRAIKPRW